MTWSKGATLAVCSLGAWRGAEGRLGQQPYGQPGFNQQLPYGYGQPAYYGQMYGQQAYGQPFVEQPAYAQPVYSQANTGTPATAAAPLQKKRPMESYIKGFLDKVTAPKATASPVAAVAAVPTMPPEWQAAANQVAEAFKHVDQEKVAETANAAKAAMEAFMRNKAQEYKDKNEVDPQYAKKTGNAKKVIQNMIVGPVNGTVNFFKGTVSNIKNMIDGVDRIKKSENPVRELYNSADKMFETKSGKVVQRFLVPVLASTHLQDATPEERMLAGAGVLAGATIHDMFAKHKTSDFKLSDIFNVTELEEYDRKQKQEQATEESAAPVPVINLAERAPEKLAVKEE